MDCFDTAVHHEDTVERCLVCVKQMARGFLNFFVLWFLIPFKNTSVLSVQIGAFTNPATRIGREQKVAILLAVEKFSPQTLLAGVLDLNTTDPFPIYSYVQTLVQLGANAIISGGTGPQAFIAGTAGDGTKVPIVSLASSPFLSGRYLVQMSYPETAPVRCIADIVKSYKWRKVIVVYEDDAFSSVSSTAFLLSNALRAIGSEIEYRAIFPPADSIYDPISTVREELRHTKLMFSTVYIILRISEELARILFEEAASQKLMSKGHIWICGNDITTLLDSSFTPSFISKNMQGVVGIKSYINESNSEYINFRSNFQQRFRTEYENSGEKSFDPGVYAVRAYDVLAAISLAARTSEGNNKTLVENLAANNFSGLSGIIRLTNESLDDSERCSVFQIINVVGRSYWEMAIWADGHGFYDNEDEYMLQLPCSERLKTVVVWPGRSPTTPAGFRRLKVLIPTSNIWDNFVVVENYDRITGKFSSVSGFCIDVFMATLNCLGYEVLYDFFPYNDTDYNNLVEQVHTGKADIVVGDVTILANRSENVSFTKPYLSSGLAMLVPLKTNMKGWLPTKAFSLGLWMCILVLLVYYVMLVWYHELVEAAVPDFQYNWLKQLGASLWIVCNAIFLNLDKRIRSYHTKIVMILWFFVAQLVLNSFTASLSSILVTQKLRPVVHHPLKIGSDGGSFVKNYLISVLKYPSDINITDIFNASEYNEKFKKGDITAAYLEVPYLRVFLSQYDNYTVYNETQMLGGFGFVLPKGSLLTNDMSEAILKLGENGTLRQLEKKWFPVSLSNYVSPDDERNERLDPSNYIYMFIISSCLALLTVIHRCFDTICHYRGGQVVTPEQAQQEPRPASEVQLVVTPIDARVQHVQHGIHNEQLQEEQHLHEGVPEDEEQTIHEEPETDDPLINQTMHEMQDVPPNDAIHNIFQQPLGRQNADTQQEMGSTRLRARHAASFSNVPMPTRVLQSFSSLQPLRVEEPEEQPSHDGRAHRTENPSNLEPQNNDSQSGPSNFSQGERRTASSSNISRTPHLLNSFLSLHPQRVQDIENQALLYSAAHETEGQFLHNPSIEIEEPASALRNNNAESGLSSTLRYRRFNSAN